MTAAPKPVVLVFQDVGPQPHKSAHFGEVMATLSRRLGVVGLVTNGFHSLTEQVARIVGCPI